MWPRDGGGGAAGTTCAWLSPAGSEDRFRNIIYISLQAGKVGGMYKTEKKHAPSQDNIILCVVLRKTTSWSYVFNSYVLAILFPCIRKAASIQRERRGSNQKNGIRQTK